jgi:hypothetical protein
MDPNSSVQPPPQAPQVFSQPSEDDSSTNKKAIIAVSSFAFILFMAATFAYYFVFIGPYSSPEDNLAIITSSYETKTTPPPPTPTPTVNPWVIIKQAYANPFEDETQYENPFEESDNPFADL